LLALHRCTPDRVGKKLIEKSLYCNIILSVVKRVKENGLATPQKYNTHMKRQIPYQLSPY
jgi:hypothetical protein